MKDRNPLTISESLGYKFPHLLEEWNWDKNEISPWMILPQSHKTMWWICPIGHHYVLKCKERTKQRRKCIYCYGNKILPHFNDLLTINPDIGIEWDYEKNIVDPSLISPNNSSKFWWKCKNGHSYQAKCSNRNLLNRGCPYCSGRKPIVGLNDLLTTHPEIAKQWDIIKNKNLHPYDVSYGSTKKVWWLCQNNHSFKQQISVRVKSNTDCPYCTGKRCLSGFNDLSILYPEIIEEWDYEKNDKLLPTMVTPGSGRKVWWICKNNHSYKASCYSRCGQQTECPYCSIPPVKLLVGFNDLQTTNPEVAKEWDYERNKNIRPDMIFAGTQKKFWWICPNGHNYYSVCSSRTKSGSNCPICNESKGEKLIKTWLENNNIKYEREYKFDGCFSKRTLPFDFYLPDYNICIEFNGKQHYEPIKFFGGHSTFQIQQINDSIKEKFCINNHINFIIIPYYMIDDIESILSENIRV